MEFMNTFVSEEFNNMRRFLQNISVCLILSKKLTTEQTQNS